VRGLASAEPNSEPAASLVLSEMRGDEGTSLASQHNEENPDENVGIPVLDREQFEPKTLAHYV
jgi:hypothetical protein